MTLIAGRAGQSANVEVQYTGGPVTIRVVEQAAHLRHFWHELGEVLDQIEHAAPDAGAGKGM